jgi:hypothetical protein
VEYSGVKWSKVDYSRVHWSTLESILEYSGVQWSTVHYSGIHLGVQWSACVQYSELQWSAIRCSKVLCVYFLFKDFFSYFGPFSKFQTSHCALTSVYCIVVSAGPKGK